MRDTRDAGCGLGAGNKSMTASYNDKNTATGSAYLKVEGVRLHGQTPSLFKGNSCAPLLKRTGHTSGGSEKDGRVEGHRRAKRQKKGNKEGDF